MNFTFTKETRHYLIEQSTMQCKCYAQEGELTTEWNRKVACGFYEVMTKYF